MSRVTRDGVSIFYERDGQAQRAEPNGSSEDRRDTKPAGSVRRGGPAPVVFLQDLGCGRWMWRWQREQIWKSFDVIAPDTRGTGRSDTGLSAALRRLPRRLRSPLLSSVAGYSMEGLAADLEAVLADAGISDVHLVGAGMGGMIAQQYALEYARAASLTLCCTSHGGPDAVSTPAETRELIRSAPKNATERETIRRRMRQSFTERFLNRNPHLFDRIVEWRLEQDAADPERSAQANAVDAFDVSRQLSQIGIPTLILHGTADRIVPVENARLLETKIPRSRLETFEGGSHRFFIEQNDVVTDRLLSFLSEQTQTASQY